MINSQPNPSIHPTRMITVTVNGLSHSHAVEPRLILADFLRHTLRLTGTHLGCEHGVCGACTVLLDGAPVRACLILAIQVDGQHLETVEGVADGAVLAPVQQALWEEQGLQCGFCTPGIVMTLTELLRRIPDPTELEIKDALSGNLCRCTGYQPIVAAAKMAAERSR